MKRLFLLIYLVLFLYGGIGGYLRADLDKEVHGENRRRSQETGTVLYKGVEFRDEQQVLELKKREALGIFFRGHFICRSTSQYS